MFRPQSICRVDDLRHFVPHFDGYQISGCLINMTTARFLNGGYSGFEGRQSGKLYGGSWPDGDAQCQLSLCFVGSPALGRVPRVDQFDACALVVAHIASRQREPATDGYCCDRAVAKVNRFAGCLSAREDAAKRVCAFPIKR